MASDNGLLNAVVAPVDSQLTVNLLREISSIVHVRAYGDVFCVLLDGSHQFGSCSSNPALTFLNAHSIGEPPIYPVTILSETRHVLGMDADAESRRVVVGHFNYSNERVKEKLIKIDIYTVDEDFNATLTRVLSMNTSCTGSELLGSFVSSRVGEFTALYGSDTFFDTFTVTVKDEIEVKVSITRTHLVECAVKFRNLDQIYPGPASTVYSISAKSLKDTHPDCIALKVYQVQLSPHAHPEEVFRCVVSLSRELNLVTRFRSRPNFFDASFVSMVHRADGTSRALVRVELQEYDPEAATENTEGSVGVDSVVGALDRLKLARRKVRHTYVFFLLDMQNNTVLDMYATLLLDDSCAIDASGEHIVRFVSKEKHALRRKIETLSNQWAVDTLALCMLK